MAKFLSFTVYAALISTISIIACCAFADDRKVYIVYMGAIPKSDYSPLTHHHNLLQEVLENSLPSDSLIHSYKRSFNGFAANLTERESQKLSGMEGILSVFPSRKLKLQTTRSWDFMGFKENVKRSPTVESNVIVGMIDSGIWPEAESFSDEGFSPPPKKWKGICKGGQNFTCNNLQYCTCLSVMSNNYHTERTHIFYLSFLSWKIIKYTVIGARFYIHAIDENHNSARDTIGHGTHTASTAAGSQVNKASFYGLAPGNTRGAVPSARIAVYKVCWEYDFCEDSEVLAAFDDAIADGVDIISISIGSNKGFEYHKDSIAIGAFHAMQKGVLTSQSAGNSGPDQSTVTSIAPWKLSVAASTTDRQFIVKVVLGDNTTLVGSGISPFDMKGKKFPLIDFDSTSLSSCNESSARLCAKNHLDTTNSLTGKVIFKTSPAMEQELYEKAAGVIWGSDDDDGFDNYPLPASRLSYKDGERVSSYIKTQEILKTEAIRNDSAPVVPSFSSRGPNPFTKDILKPDISAPGVDLLAAWSPEAIPTVVGGDERSTKYNIMSGTSMACPHVTGAAAYVKTFHPDWSPAAIKSALMTTAFPLNATTNPDAEIAYGSGHIDPVKAINPGLIYEALEDDYIRMLYNIGYTPKQINIFSGRNDSCSKLSKGSPKDLNYPTMISDVAEAKFTRTVTNVGIANSTYRATITSPLNLKISATPEVLTFKSLNETKSFVVTTSTKARSEYAYLIISASLVWSDGVHHVRSPIVVHDDECKTQSFTLCIVSVLNIIFMSPLMYMLGFLVEKGSFSFRNVRT
ncbi:hypothetical protein AQUCO_01300855v1 [Aquilegia coerulea]|uniref:Inhibitor I9 domain-containing protein n=1 Tax=Aquilegia coerulea TaxID=218851 RepID=A0A2G5E3P4_AQUCA|nr:hypothetical protein AQUCO_01300855v1 [Aquilegia coerulea]